MLTIYFSEDLERLLTGRRGYFEWWKTFAHWTCFFLIPSHLLLALLSHFFNGAVKKIFPSYFWGLSTWKIPWAKLGFHLQPIEKNQEWFGAKQFLWSWWCNALKNFRTSKSLCFCFLMPNYKTPSTNYLVLFRLGNSPSILDLECLA